jgi:predicted RNase H-like HicB family nuclease
MELEGKVWKDGNFWLIEVPSLNITTQGKSKRDALFMLKDAVLGLMESYFGKLNENFDISVHDYKKGNIGLSSNDIKLLLSFLLIRKREENGLSIRQVAKRLQSKNPNSYAQYEKGRINFSIDQYEKLMHAINPRTTSIWRVF